ncbi:MAG: carboxypeptidase regulatory-like domain-containing protein [Bryobacteraceae bacterium]
MYLTSLRGSLAFVVLFLAAADLRAQTAGARIRGTVTDTSGARVASASVALVQVDTAVARRTVADDEGNYTFVSLPVGHYRITAEAAGFKRYEQTGILLAVDQRADLDITLEVGQVTEVVNVAAQVAPVDTQTGTLKQVIDSRRMVDLPLNGRDATQLLTLVAGVLPTRGGVNKQSSTLANTFFSVNGARDNTVNFQMDGTDQNDPYTNVANPFPNPDALQEFSVQTNNFDAEFGRNSGAVVNAVTKSGTNELHGSAFEFLRNGNLNARNFFSSGQDTLKRNQFGGTLGGPVFVPRLYNGRDRSFIFFSYQGTRISEAPSNLLTLTPSEAERRGNFSSRARAIVDPETGSPFPGNVIPTSRLDPSVQRMTGELLPLPNRADGFISYSLPRTTRDDQYIIKFDQGITDFQRLSVRYFLYDFTTPSVLIPGNFFATRNAFLARNQNSAINHTWTVSPRLVNTFNFGYSRLNTDQPTPSPVTVSDFGVNIFTAAPKTISVGVSGYFSISSQNPVPNTRNTFQYSNTTSLTYGRHLLRWGADIRRIRQYWSTIFTQNGSFGFNGQITGDALADYFLGRPSSFSQSGQLFYDARFTGWNFFVQDNIKVTRKLTVDAGLRYEPYIPPYFVRTNRTAQFRERDYAAGKTSTVYRNAPPGIFYYGDEGVPRSGTTSYLKALSPRLGLAYDLTGKSRTVLRAAYGLFWDQPKMIQLNRFTTTQPFSQNVVVPAPPSFTDPYQGRDNPFPRLLQLGPDVDFFQPLALTITYPEEFIQASIQQWNFNIEHLMKGVLLRAAYVGTKGTHLNWPREINPATYIPGQSTLANTDSRRPFAPHFSSMGRMYQDGNSSYHSFQLNLERRFSRGFTVLVNYTYSKFIDSNSSTVEVAVENPVDLRNLRLERGLSNFDVTQNFVTSFVWELPIGSTGNRFADLIVRNWQTNGIIVLRSGLPYNVVTGLDRQFTGMGSQRPDLVSANPELSSSRPRGEQLARYFDTSAFVLNELGVPGTAGRNIMRGPGFANVDFSLFKNFPLHERAQLQFRSEFFNLLNRPNFNNPNGVVSSPLFGTILSATDPRIVQFGLRLVF